MVFACALAHPQPDGGAALVDLRRVGFSYFSVGAPIWRDVHRSFDSYLRHDIANVFTACNVNVCEQRVNYGGDDQCPECHSRSYQHSHYTQAAARAYCPIFSGRVNIFLSPNFSLFLKKTTFSTTTPD
jgi:hypothetical protein